MLNYCSRCKQMLPIELFSKKKKSPTGYSYICKHCAAEKHSTWQKENKLHLNEYQEKWNKNNKVKKKAYNKKWRDKQNASNND